MHEHEEDDIRQPPDVSPVASDCKFTHAEYIAAWVTSTNH